MKIPSAGDIDQEAAEREEGERLREFIFRFTFRFKCSERQRETLKQQHGVHCLDIAKKQSMNEWASASH